jgi:hypothetical protein
MNPTSGSILWALAALLAAAPLCAQAQGNAPIQLQIERGAYGVILTASGPDSTNFVLQSATNLGSWTIVLQSLGSPGTNPVYYAPAQAEAPSQLFWRALPGESVTTQQQRWHQAEPSEYTFYLRYMISFWAGGVRGTVRVVDGTIVAVTDALDDQSGQPIPNPALSQFLTIDQVFTKIKGAYEAGVQQVQVVYDSSGLYPVRVSIDPLIGAVDDESLIEISNFVPIR